jgi:hypothetical protein
VTIEDKPNQGKVPPQLPIPILIKVGDLVTPITLEYMVACAGAIYHAKGSFPEPGEVLMWIAISIVFNPPAQPQPQPPKEEKARPNPKAPNTSTQFNYTTSPYFEEAKKQTIGIHEPNSQTTLVLAIILAWCNCPLFRDTGERHGNWMILPLTHFKKEANLSRTDLEKCLINLQNEGLIFILPLSHIPISSYDLDNLKIEATRTTPDWGGDQFFKRGTIQENSRVYNLNFKRYPCLPIFKPFNLEEKGGN